MSIQQIRRRIELRRRAHIADIIESWLLAGVWIIGIAWLAKTLVCR